MLTALSGQIERITFTNEENGFTIAQVRVYGRKELVTVVGHLTAPSPGEVLEMKGTWTSHPRFGEQFQIETYQTRTPATVVGIKKYLGSGLVRGIGPVMADRIVNAFGKKTLDIIEQEIHRLSEIDGIGQKRIAMIREAWDAQREIRNVMLFLQENSVSPTYAAKIYKAYGRDAVSVVNADPYQLAMDIWGIGFVTADRIAQSLGFAKTAEKRLRAGIIYVLNQLSEEGHVYYPRDLLFEKCSQMLEVPADLLGAPLNAVAELKKIVVETVRGANSNGEQPIEAVYLARYHVSETGIARFVARLAHAAMPFKSIDTHQAIHWVAPQLGIELAHHQVQAIATALSHPMMVLTGGPGTGKTTIINAILKILLRLNLSVMMAAPTGRAAKRMGETTGREAKTIHRLLEFSIQKGGFAKNDDSPLVCDALIIDEASMIDCVLMYHLLKAIKPGTLVIFVGDIHQLPSVGAGNVLNDIIRSQKVPVKALTKIFRQARSSRIIVNAHLINQGKLPLPAAKGVQTDFYFIEQENPERVVDMVLTMIQTRIPKRFGFDPVDDIQLLTPMHRGIVGAANFNARLQEVLNPNREKINRGGREYRVGDKVMQIRNNYDKDVFNGDIGRIFRIFPEEQEVVITFDQRRVTYDYSDLDQIILAYAVSIHKSQGSEYPAVVVPVMPQHYILLQRNLLYTAVTRGKQLVVLVGTKKALAIAVNNNTPQKRHTLLCERLI